MYRSITRCYYAVNYDSSALCPLRERTLDFRGLQFIFGTTSSDLLIK